MAMGPGLGLGSGLMEFERAYHEAEA
jgi:hypothetical protein